MILVNLKILKLWPVTLSCKYKYLLTVYFWLQKLLLTFWSDVNYHIDCRCFLLLLHRINIFSSRIYIEKFIFQNTDI